MYHSIFCTEFNLGFGSPRSDTCSRYETIEDNNLFAIHKEMTVAAFDQQKVDRKEVSKYVHL